MQTEIIKIYKEDNQTSLSQITGIIKNTAVIILCISLITVLWLQYKHISNTSRNLDTVTAELIPTIQALRDTSLNIKDFAAYQTTELKSEKNRKSIEASLSLAAAGVGTIRSINTLTLPRINHTMDSLNQSAQSLNIFVKNADEQINGAALPEVTNLIRNINSNIEFTAQKLGVSLDSINLAILEISKQGQLSLTEINKILADPNWAATLENIAETSKQTALTAEQIKIASQKVPLIADSLQKIAATSNKYTKIVLLFNLISSIVRIF